MPLAGVLGVLPVLATDVLRGLRMIKDASEIDALRKAGSAIDRVHARVPEFLIPGRTEADVAEAQSAIDRAANLPTDKGLVLRDMWLLRLRALLARARGDDVAYRDLADRYRAMSTSLGFEGHMAMANSMM